MRFPRTLVAEFARKLAAQGLIVGSEGNISLKAKEYIYTTPTGVLKAELTPSQVVVMDSGGKIVEGGRPSSEWPMHVAIYQKRPDVKAVVHAHPPYTLALSLAGFDFSRPLLAEAVIFLKEIAVIPFALPGTEEVPKAMEPYLQKSRVFILERHGAVTLGKDLAEAFNLMLILEQVSRVTWLALSLNSEAKPLSPEELERLRQS